MMWWIPILTCVLALVATAILHHYQKLPRILIKTRMVVILTYIAVAILGIGLGLLLREIVVKNQKDPVEPVLKGEQLEGNVKGSNRKNDEDFPTFFKKTLSNRQKFAEIEGKVQGFISEHKNDEDFPTLLENFFTDLHRQMSEDEFLQLQENIENWLKQNESV